LIAVLVSIFGVIGCGEDAQGRGGSGGGGTAGSNGARTIPTTPNILFVFTDDHAAHAVSAYGSTINQTPNIDRLAQEGMLFRSAFVTNSLCAPSRAVTLTGEHSHLNGVFTNNQVFEDVQVTFPKLLQAAGYQMAILGKWHLISEPAGFDYWEVLPGQGRYYNPEFRTPDGVVQDTGYVTDIITDKALDWLAETRDPDRPFMLMIQHKAPHGHWDPGPEHLRMYDDQSILEPETLFDDYSGRASAAKTTSMTIAGHLGDRSLKLVPSPELNDQQLALWNAAYEPKNAAFREQELSGDDLLRWKYQRYIKDYLRTVASVDDNLGRILDYLDDSGLAEQTVVVYSSDQGLFLGDHGWYDKRFMYEESLRIPLIVRWPGVVEAGTENAALVQNLDFAETFLDVAGLQIPANMQGRSLVPLLAGRTPDDWRQAIYYQYYSYPRHSVQNHYGVRTDRYKLIHYHEIDEWELFDLHADPRELNSVYDDAGYTEPLDELRLLLQDLQARYLVPEHESAP
jgi:arylsulfatase A-like enzyme